MCARTARRATRLSNCCRLAGRDSRDAVARRILARPGGNPLQVVELIRSVGERPTLEADALATVVPASVRAITVEQLLAPAHWARWRYALRRCRMIRSGSPAWPNSPRRWRSSVLILWRARSMTRWNLLPTCSRSRIGARCAVRGTGSGITATGLGKTALASDFVPIGGGWVPHPAWSGPFRARRSIQLRARMAAGVRVFHRAGGIWTIEFGSASCSSATACRICHIASTPELRSLLLTS